MLNYAVGGSLAFVASGWLELGWLSTRFRDFWSNTTYWISVDLIAEYRRLEESMSSNEASNRCRRSFGCG